VGIRQTAFLDRKEKDMYVKIVGYLDDEQGVSSKQGNPEAPVVPRKQWIFEAEEVHYTKVKVPDIDSLGYGRSLVGLSSGDKDFEVLRITLRTDGTHEYLNARKCILYLMNNEGKTIDSMTCL